MNLSETECCRKNIRIRSRSNKQRDLCQKELLYMKFLQGIPVVGAVGGAYDAVYMKRITEYAELKYRHRYLAGRKKAENKLLF